ncbi:MAG TPA: baseplate J/gp47 family protein [Ktedonobacteraceae bacterium]
MSDEKKPVSHYELKTLLRRDGFGAVYLSQDTRDGKAYILRVIELDSPTLARITGRVRSRSQRDHPLIEQIRQRMKRISELKHAHVLPVVEFGEEHIQGNNDIIFYMVSPYERESLLSYWSGRAGSNELISLESIADLIFQAGEALFYVHKRGLIHQYVRLSSFMLRSSTRGRRGPHLLLTDFWFADITPALLEAGQISQDLSLYLAPEQLSGRALATSDQYALALLAYELLLGYRLSQVDLSPGLYAHALRQRSSGASPVELALAHRLDLVLARALAEDATARFSNIEEFVYTFRAVARGEAVDLSDEETSELPVVEERPQHTHGEAMVAGFAGALATGEQVEEGVQTSVVDAGTAELLSAAQIDEQTRLEHRHSLHRTVLTSRGMETLELAKMEMQGVSGEEQERAGGAEERAPSSAETFVLGLEAGATLRQEQDIVEERTLVRESSALAFAAGLSAGEVQGLAQEAAGVEELAPQMPEENQAATGPAGLRAGELSANGAAARAAGVMQRADANVSGFGTGNSGSQQAASAALTTAGAGVFAGRRRQRRPLLVAIAVALLLVLFSSGLFVFASSQATATVTLTLQSRIVHNTYLVTAATTQGQVQARKLTQTVAQSRTTRASGYYPGTRASGLLTFHNTSTSCGCPIFIPAGTPFTSRTGVTVVTAYDISVAAQCVVTVPARAVIYGAGGNVPADSVHATFGAHVWGTNRQAFTGGQSGQSNALVQQADINNLTSALQTQNEHTARSGLESQLHSSQRLADSPLCRSRSAADHPAGAAAAGVTVTVTTTCAAEAYDYARVVQIVQQQVQAQAASYFSSNFVEVGSLQTTVAQATVTDARTGRLLLAVQAAGRWVYRFDQSLKRSLARVIAGKDVTQVRALLNNEAGVAAVNVSLSGPSQNTLPSDDAKIAIVLRD